MGSKSLLALFVLVALANAAPASNNQVTHMSAYYDFIQYVMPITPSDKVLFQGGLKLAALGRCEAAFQRGFCQEQFAKRLGKTVDIFNDPIQFAKLVAGFYKLQINKGILNLCSAQVEFRNCLGVFYPACTDAFNIFRDELKDINKAFILAGVYDDIEFDCGGGVTQGLENWKCIVKVNNNGNFDTTINTCFDDYNKTITKDPRPDVYCPAGKTLSLCIASGYQSLDKCANHAVQWWACERAARRTRLEGFCDHNPCADVFPKPPTTVTSSESDRLMEFVNSGGLISEAQHAFFKMAGMSRDQKKAVLAAKR
jgi:hypothetical protein